MLCTLGDIQNFAIFIIHNFVYCNNNFSVLFLGFKPYEQYAKKWACKKVITMVITFTQNANISALHCQIELSF